MPKFTWTTHIAREDCPIYEVENRYTITQRPNRSGWETDSASRGYGLPKGLAQWICEQLNKSDDECPYVMDKFGCWIQKDKDD